MKQEIYKIRHTLEELQKTFTLESFKGHYTLRLSSKPNQYVYSGGQCVNKSGRVGHENVVYNIKCVIYCLLNRCPYIDHRNSTIIPSEALHDDNSYKFNVWDIRCLIKRGMEWKDAPTSLNTFTPKPAPVVSVQTQLNLTSVPQSNGNIKTHFICGRYANGKPFVKFGYTNYEEKVDLMSLAQDTVNSLMA